eukprot:259715-Hanusia_phi.AAC.1
MEHITTKGFLLPLPSPPSATWSRGRRVRSECPACGLRHSHSPAPSPQPQRTFQVRPSWTFAPSHDVSSYGGAGGLRPHHYCLP